MIMTSPVHVGRALESLRNSDFDTLSALGEVVDNSIQANAKNIRIRVSQTKIRKNKYDLTEIAFADDGDGMDKDTLGKCLQLGFSARYNDRKGIGRFGVGMTLGAVTQCTRIEVYSKPRGGAWNFTYIDLAEMKDVEDPIIPDPTPAEVPRNYADLVDDYGTLVVWKNLDREDAKIDDMVVWLGRTYRKFIGKEVIDDDNRVVENPNRRRIFIDDGETNREISALDPLYVTKTEYSQEVTALETPIVLEELVSEIDSPDVKPTEPKKITIRMSLLPAAWRPRAQYSGNSKENMARKVPHNEGISILRNDREVFYGHIPYYRIRDTTSSHNKGFLDMDRFWGCEISFDADMDHWFSIKNIKVGARPIPDLREQIEDTINDTILDFRKDIRKVWNSEKAKEREDTSGALSQTGDSEEAMKKSSPSSSPASKNDIDKIIKDVGNIKQGVTDKLKDKLAKYPVVIYREHNMDARGDFMDILNRAGKIVVKINMKHPFFERFFDLQEQISKNPPQTKADLETFTQSLETALEIFVGSFAQAKKDLNTESDEAAKSAIDKLEHNWTYYLKKNASDTLET